MPDKMLDDVKLVLGIDNSDSDAVLTLMISDAIQAALNYCHITELPVPLEPVVRGIVIGGFSLRNEGNIAAIKRGDTQITYGEPIGAGDFTDMQKRSLNAFRRVIKK